MHSYQIDLFHHNVIIGYECFHKIRLNKGKKNTLVALKLDISKACDRVTSRLVDLRVLSVEIPLRT